MFNPVNDIAITTADTTASNTNGLTLAYKNAYNGTITDSVPKYMPSNAGIIVS